MKFKLICIMVLLSINMVKVTPSLSKEEFLKTMFLGDMVSNLLNNLTRVVSCYEDIQKDYKDTIQYFAQSIKYPKPLVQNLFSKFKVGQRNAATIAVQELLKIAEKMKTYEKQMTKAFNERNPRVLNNSIYYTFLVQKEVEGYYDEYLKQMHFLDKKSHQGKEAVHKHIHDHSESFLYKLKLIGKWMGLCLNGYPKIPQMSNTTVLEVEDFNF